VVTGQVALLRSTKALRLVHLRAQVQALRHAGLCATLLQTSDLGTVLALIALVALAGSVVAQTMLRAVLKLSTAGHQ